MFCHQCGERLATSSRFCSHCGEKIPQSEETTTKLLESNQEENQENPNIAATIEPPEQHVEETPCEDPKQPLRKRMIKKLPILIPLMSILLVGGGVSAYYVNETTINKDVLSLQHSAENAALNGEYVKAEKELLRAQNMRPDYAVLEQNLETIARANHYTTELTSISDKIKENNFTEAEADLSTLTENITAEFDPLFDPLKDLIAAKEITVTVGKIKQELAELTTVNQLADKLNTISTLSSEEATAVKDQILTKIVQLTSEQAEHYLQNKQFSDAIASVNRGLEYATNNEKLSSFKDKIEQERDAFERAEVERLEKAMEAAAKEDLQNRTAAVDMNWFEAHVDEYGDLYLSGEVTNVATKTISSITIYYTVYDLEGYYLYDSWTTVFPFSLSPGEQGSFDDVVYYLFEDVNVSVDNITWYVE
jgi:hypothetical protein